ncbi:hypothetical protein PMI27_000434 [Pseudomonas sp. GM41(2012)]|nr:hypothetical protein PMI27_000434 [Pseudomonas sp. GM41(2012)]
MPDPMKPLQSMKDVVDVRPIIQSNTRRLQLLRIR